MRASSASYKGHRFLRELIARAVWLYFRFRLSFRLALLWQKTLERDSLDARSLLHRRPAMMRAGDGRGLVSGSGRMA